tara:strand:- start:4184 stop:5311 length:1128 start_codon:yes stop_codon:yes gene_type:complete
MIKSKEFIKQLKKNDINFFTGVPDSLFSNLCNKLAKFEKSNHVLSVNEGSSVGIAIGYYLATKKVPLVYLQNSGLGNIINPLISLADKKVFNIPIFFLIGWRGEILEKNKQIKDEPQHRAQGLITPELLKILNIKFKILSKKSNFKKDISLLSKYAKQKNKTVALLIRKESFEKEEFKRKIYPKSYLSREEALLEVRKQLPDKIPIISTTGMLSRELNEINIKNNLNESTFMCVGGMGHAISIATGLAKFKKKKKILCLDGDGAALMHLGAQANSAKLNNLIHIVFNNYAHDSVDGERPPSENINFYKLASELGYNKSFIAKTTKEIKRIIKFSLKSKKSVFIEITCTRGHRKNLTRPKKDTIYYKNKFMGFLKK